jgi:hypothetical protein
MGEAKRRKAILGDRYGQPSTDTIGQKISKYLKNRSVENLEELALVAVPKRLAYDFAVKVDSEQIVPPCNPKLPEDWPFEMRCIESHYPAKVFVLDFAKRCKDFHSIGPGEAVTIGCQIVALAAQEVDIS